MDDESVAKFHVFVDYLVLENSSNRNEWTFIIFDLIEDLVGCEWVSVNEHK